MLTDYLEEALEGLDTLVRRLRRIEASAANKAESVDYFPNMSRKTQGFSGKSRNVSKNRTEVDEPEFDINYNLKRVYNSSGVGSASPWGAAALDGGGSGAVLWPAEPEDAPTMRTGGRDSGPVPQHGAEASWISGEETAPRTPAEWLPGGEPEARTPAGWLPGGGTEARMTAGRLPGGAAESRTPAGGTDLSAAPMSEETRWAEQADRAFRRDSRRYDGGFYLY